MDEKTRATLAEINRAFYARFAGDFAGTRRGWPLGFERILPHLRQTANVLDLGCGNGRLLAFLADRGWRGSYLGLDSSAGLLAEAENWRNRISHPRVAFRDADLLTPGWTASATGFTPDAIVALAVLHHIPGGAMRRELLAQCAALLPPGGALILSTWQFLGSSRLRKRILPWATVGLADEQVEPGDYLVAWGKDAASVRYCAALDADALVELTAAAGLAPIEMFHADGHEGNLSLYGVFRRATAT